MIYLPYLQAHCKSHTSQGTGQSFVKELAKANKKKKKFLKNAQPHDKKINENNSKATDNQRQAKKHWW